MTHPLTTWIRKNGAHTQARDDLATAMHLMLSTEARERIGPMRIYKAPRPQRPKQQAKEETPQPAGETLPPS